MNPDPWQNANNPQMPKSELWGKVNLAASHVGLIKGIGKEPFDPAKHKRAWTNVEIFIDPLPELDIENLNICIRNMLAESKEWRNIVLPSLHNLGIQDVRTVHGQWARVEQVPTGDTYIKDGMTKERTTFKFIALYVDEATCRAAYLAENNNTPVVTTQATTNGEYALAAKFLKPIVENAWRNNNGNYEKSAAEIASKIAAIPILARHFSAESAEVVNLLMAQAGINT